MRYRQFVFSSILMFSGLCIGQSFFQAGAQQKPGEKAASAAQEEPVALTARTKVEKSLEPRNPGPDEFGNFRFPIINNKGEIAFMALFVKPGASNNSGQAMFVRQPNGSWKITHEGEKPANLADTIFGFGVPSFNDNGDLTFFSGLGDPSKKVAVLDPNDPASQGAVNKGGGLFLKNSTGLKNLVRLGDEVPKMPSHFSGFSNGSTNSKGVTAFVGMYSDPDGKGLFMVEDGKLRLVVRSGQKVGVLGGDETFSEHYYPSAINDRNEVAFMARIGEKSGIFVSRPSTPANPSGIELVAFVGRPSPIKGSNFLGFGNRTPSINSKGEVAFVAFYDAVKAEDAGRGLFLKGVTGAAQVVAKKGDAVPTGGTFEDFLSPAINARGEIAFIGNFSGKNRGMFIKTAKGIEPIALLDQKIPGSKNEFEIFNNFQQPSINDKGEVVFYAQLKNADVALFHRDEKGVLHTLARRGDKMPK
ncbi:MAG: choice-of-anchor tandem repeat NxxGxxAF-containing protein [Blastocatellia bacterium]